MPNDDSDMKIAGEYFRPPQNSDDAQEMKQQLEHEKSNGNLNRARRLGAIMAEEVTEIEGSDCTEEAAFLAQRRLLMAFTVEIGLDLFLPSPLLARTALSVFYETLRQISSSFYDDLRESGAFSFYYLRVREGRDVARKVGETFASLCGKAGNMVLTNKGQAMYTHFIQTVESAVEQIDFV